jgi:S1-C subfamily serine protease
VIKFLDERRLITRFGDVSLDETHSYINALFQCEAGDRVKVQLVRGNHVMDVEVTLGESRQWTIIPIRTGAVQP